MLRLIVALDEHVAALPFAPPLGGVPREALVVAERVRSAHRRDRRVAQRAFDAIVVREDGEVFEKSIRPPRFRVQSENAQVAVVRGFGRRWLPCPLGARKLGDHDVFAALVRATRGEQHVTVARVREFGQMRAIEIPDVSVDARADRDLAGLVTRDTENDDAEMRRRRAEKTRRRQRERFSAAPENRRALEPRVGEVQRLPVPHDFAPERGKLDAVERDAREAAIGRIDRLAPRVADAVEEAGERDAHGLVGTELVEGATIAHVTVRDLIDIAATHDAFLVAAMFSGAE